MVSFKGAHFAQDIILTCVRWYVAYPLSYRQLGPPGATVRDSGLAYYRQFQGRVSWLCSLA
jgi:transposase-like protein